MILFCSILGYVIGTFLSCFVIGFDDIGIKIIFGILGMVILRLNQKFCSKKLKNVAQIVDFQGLVKIFRKTKKKTCFFR